MNKESKYDIVKFIDGEFELEVSVNPKKETIWMTQEQMSILFNKAKSTINEHIKNILKNELDVENVVRKFGKTELSYIKTKYILMYNLDMIISIGYRNFT